MERDAKLTSLYHRNSALTEFLNERNIRASVIRDRYLRIENGDDNNTEGIDEENPDNQDERTDEEQQDETTDNPEPESSSTAQRRKRRVKSKASNESSDSEPKSESESESGQNGRMANGTAKGNKKDKKRSLLLRNVNRNDLQSAKSWMKVVTTTILHPLKTKTNIQTV